MSTEKLASNLSILLNAALAGSGAYSAGRLLSEIAKRSKAKKEDDLLNTLKIPDLEKKREELLSEKKSWSIDQNSKEAGMASSFLTELALAGGGAAGGYYATKKLFDAINQSKLQAQLKKEQAAYEKELLAFNQNEFGKTASLSDLYFEYEAEKQAVISPEAKKIMMLTGGIALPAAAAVGYNQLQPEHIQKARTALNDATDTALSRQSGRSAMDLVFGDLKPALYGLLGASALYSAYKLIDASRRKERKEQEASLPFTTTPQL